jgi:diguanylate cyclase (GGDEF)-like protein/PAS domain S-box-containing protein
MPRRIAKWLKKVLGLRTAARSIKQAQREWEAALDAVQELIFIHDADMRIVRANRVYAARAGKDIRDIIGKPYWTLFPKLDGPLSGCRRSLEEHQDGEEELHLDSGEEYISRTYPIYDAEGKYLYSLHVMQDVTAKRKAEAEQRTLSEALRQAAEAVLVLDADTRITYLNPAFYRLFGYAPDDIIGQPIAVLSVPERENNLQPSEVIRRLNKNGTCRGEVWRRAKDGTAIPVLLSTVAIRDARGNIVGYAGTYLDLREARQAEQALRESEEKFRQIATAAQDAIIMMDNDGCIAYWNPAAERIFGHTREEALGQELHAFIGAARYYEAYGKASQQFRFTGEGAAIGKTRELAAVRKDGTEFPVELSISAVRLGDKWSAVGILRDITERKRMEEQLNASLAEKEVLVQSLNELAIRDGLTGLYNHRAFYKLLEDELGRAQRFNRPVSLLLLDIDHFKRVNDTYGHLAGDAILRELGELLVREARAIDRVCRYGGEEITVILPETDLDAAANFAERLRAAVEAQLFDVNASVPLRITVSIGVASWLAHADSAQALVAAADTAMYAAKQSGRNLAICYEPALEQPAAGE